MNVAMFIAMLICNNWVWCVIFQLLFKKWNKWEEEGMWLKPWWGKNGRTNTAIEWNEMNRIQSKALFDANQFSDKCHRINNIYLSKLFNCAVVWRSYCCCHCICIISSRFIFHLFSLIYKRKSVRKRKAKPFLLKQPNNKMIQTKCAHWINILFISQWFIK